MAAGCEVKSSGAIGAGAGAGAVVMVGVRWTSLLHALCESC